MNKYKFHFVKLELYDGSWRTYSKPSPPRFQRLINKYKPKNVYCSLNQFINYQEHPRYKYQNSILFRCGLVDIDSQEFNSKEDAVNYFIEVLDCLNNNKINISEINITNIFGGFQIVISPESYKDFHNLININLKIFSKIDKRVLYDDKRVRRYVPSFFGNKQSSAYPLFLPDCFNNHPQHLLANPELLSKGLNSRLFQGLENHAVQLPTTGMLQNAGKGVSVSDESILTIGSTFLPILKYFEADDKGVAFNAQHISPCKIKRGQESSSNLPSRFIVRQISNSVFGAKGLYVPYIKFNYKPSPRRIRRLQKAYNLGDIYLFKFHFGYALLSLKVFDATRLRKIYKAFKSYSSYNEFLKFNQNWIFISNIIDLSNNQKIKSFGFLELYPAEAKGYYSNTHLYWMAKSSFWQSRIYNNITGKQSEIYIAEFKRDLQCGTNKILADADTIKTGI